MLSFRFKWIFNYCIPVPLVPWTPLSPSAPILIYTPTWLLRRTLYGKNISSNRTLKNYRSISFFLSLSTLQAFTFKQLLNWLLVLPHVQYNKLYDSCIQYFFFQIPFATTQQTLRENSIYGFLSCSHTTRRKMVFCVLPNRTEFGRYHRWLIFVVNQSVSNLHNSGCLFLHEGMQVSRDWSLYN